jgi:hypothetical protein
MTKIPAGIKLVKVDGSKGFGPEEILVGKPVEPQGTFEV